MKKKESRLYFEQNAAGWKMENIQQNISQFNLEKRNYKKKTISELRQQDASTTNNGNVILDQTETYFKNLYTSDYTYSNEDWDSFTLNLKIPKLSDEDRDNLEGQLKYDKCKKVLETFQARPQH